MFFLITLCWSRPIVHNITSDATRNSNHEMIVRSAFLQYNSGRLIQTAIVEDVYPITSCYLHHVCLQRSSTKSDWPPAQTSSLRFII